MTTSLFTPESTKLLWHQWFPIELVASSHSHAHINKQQVKDPRLHHHWVATPNDSSDKESNLLGRWDEMSWLLHVSNVCEGDAPFECGCPEEDYRIKQIKINRDNHSTYWWKDQLHGQGMTWRTGAWSQGRWLSSGLQRQRRTYFNYYLLMK